MGDRLLGLVGKLIGVVIAFLLNILILRPFWWAVYKWKTRRRPFLLPFQARFEHTHIVGGSGHGKTQLLQTLFLLTDLESLQEGKRSVIVIDSQGDLINNILHLKEMESLSERLVIIDPNDISHPPALNLFDLGLDRLSGYAALDREKLLNGAIELYEYMFGSLLGAELTARQGTIFRYLARLLMTVPGATIETLMDFMENPEAVRPHLTKLDRMSRHFFESQFFSPVFDTTRQQILTRIWAVFSNPVLERMFAHEKNKVDMFSAMNRGSLILINTSKGLLKQEGCEILGKFFIALISQAAQERDALPVEMRTPTFVYIDEAHDYFDERMENLLVTARKYRVGLILAHQHLDQFSPSLRAAVSTNTSIKMVGGLSPSDTAVFAKEMNTDVDGFREIRKGERETGFACFIRNRMQEPKCLDIPFGLMESRPRLSEAELEQIRKQNRARFCEAREELTPVESLKSSGLSDHSAIGRQEVL